MSGADLQYSRPEAIRILMRASHATHGSGASVPLKQLSKLAAVLGLDEPAVLASASRERASTVASTLLGAPTHFYCGISLQGRVSSRALRDAIADAGLTGGSLAADDESSVWMRTAGPEIVRISTDGHTRVDILAERNATLGFIQWLAPGAGAVGLGVAYPLLSGTGGAPSLSMTLVVALATFAVARNAWARIADAWQSDLAFFAARLRILLEGTCSDRSFGAESGAGPAPTAHYPGSG